MTDRRHTLLLGLIGVLAATTALSCAPGPASQPQMETGPDAEVTPDGLHRLHHSGFQLAWVKPDVVFADYDSIMLTTPQVAYKRPPRRHSRQMSNPNFALSDHQMQQFKQALVDAFEVQFAKSEFYEIVDEPGPTTMLIEPAIIDLVVLVPTDSRPVSEMTFSTSTARMTLLMELRDSQSGEILARVAERREARRPGTTANTLTWSNSVNDAAAVRSTFKRWARVLREQLDRTHEITPSQPPPEPAT